MSQDKFRKRSRSAADGNASAPEYDFSAIANDAVAKTRAQSRQPSDFSDGQPERAKSKHELPFKKPRKGSDGENPWDQPVSRDKVMAESVPAPKRSPFARRADALEHSEGEKTAAPAPRKAGGFARRSSPTAGQDSFDLTADRDKSLRDKLFSPFRKPEGKAGKGTPEAQLDEPDGSQPTTEGKQRGLLGRFARKDEKPSAEADAFEPSPDHKHADAKDRFARRSGSKEQTEAAKLPAPTLMDDDFGDEMDAFASDDFRSPQKPSAPSPAPAAESSERRVFNAATQPNYAYMTDYPEEQPQQQPQADAPDSGLSAIKTAIAKRLNINKDEPGVEYYTPPANRAPSDIRRHQKRRNRRPWPMWAKATLFGVCLALAFFAIIYAAFYIIITSRVDYVGDSVKNTVYLTVAEKANHEADLTDTEENAAEFTEPLSIAEPNEDVKVIMVVSSDSQLGSNGGTTAKTDAIMLIAIDNQNRRLRIASIMTDTYVRIQDYQSNKLSKAYYYDTVNGDYSLSRLKQAVKDNFGVIPDNFVVVDFDALQILVERLDGVDIYVTADEAYYMSNHHRYGNFPRFNSEGPYTMSGAEALNYVRMRAVGNGDYDRVARQRKVFSQMLSKLQTLSTLELAELAYSVLPELPTDMTAGDVFSYMMNVSDLSEYEITEVTFPITNSWRYGTATVRDELEYVADTNTAIIDSSTVSSSDVVSGSDLADNSSTAPATNNKFTVIVTNFQFNATALQRYLYDNDESYLNGAAAVGVSIPEIIAPLESESPAASIDPAA